MKQRFLKWFDNGGDYVILWITALMPVWIMLIVMLTVGE